MSPFALFALAIITPPAIAGATFATMMAMFAAAHTACGLLMTAGTMVVTGAASLAEGEIDG